MNFIKNNLILKSIRLVSIILPKQHRQKAWKAGGLILLNALLDIFSLGALIPFIYLLINTEIIHSNPYVSGVYQYLGFQSENQFLMAALGLVILLFVLKNLGQIAIQNFQLSFIYGLASDLSETSLKKYYQRDYLFHLNTNTAQSLRNIASIPLNFSTALQGLIYFFTELLICLVIGTAVFIFDYQVSLIFLMLLIPGGYIFYRMKRKRIHLNHQSLKNEFAANLKNLSEALENYIPIKLNQKEGYFLQRFDRSNRAINTAYRFLNQMNANPPKVIEIIVILGIAVLFLYSLISQQTMKENLLMISVFLTAAYRLRPSVTKLFNNFIKIKMHQYALDVLYEAQKESRIPDMEGMQFPEIAFHKQVKFQEISYKYPEANSFGLRDISFEINRGDKIAFIGSSGAGKTTLIHVMMGLLNPQEGQIIVDEQAVDSLNNPYWQQLIGYVPQTHNLLDGTLRENIAFGEEPSQVNTQQLKEVIRQAGLEDFVQSLPEGLETLMGESGAKISGGQRQRVMIARALYKNAEIFILDEATSNLDQKTEEEITETFQLLARQQKTIIMISHHYRFLKNCDKIYELENGRIKQTLKYSDIVLSEAAR